MFMSLRLAPRSFEDMLLSFTSPVLRCFDIVIYIFTVHPLKKNLGNEYHSLIVETTEKYIEIVVGSSFVFVSENVVSRLLYF